MRDKFNKQLVSLVEEVKNLGLLCSLSIKTAISTLLNMDREKLGVVYSTKETIKEQTRYIENYCMKLLMRQQPVAHDLATISGALKLAQNMDRIGSQSLELAEIAKGLDDGELLNRKLMERMCNVCSGMVKDAVGAFIDKNPSLAQEIIERDHELDSLYLQVKERLSGKALLNKEDTSEAMEVLLAAKYLERIGDHAVNIAKWTKEL